jgi:5-methylcytosine-specific restriction endonuclease McrA
MPQTTGELQHERLRKWRQENREYFNRKSREYYWKNVDHLRKVCAERQRKYNLTKHPRTLSDNPIAIYQREQRKIFKEKYGISSNQIYRNGNNAIIAVRKAGRRCQICGNTGNLAIHHKDGNGRNLLEGNKKPNNNLNNLMVLCRSCHSILHNRTN